MKLGVFTCLLGNLPLEEALGYFKSKGLEMVEIGCGGYPGNSHADPDTRTHARTRERSAGHVQGHPRRVRTGAH